MTATLNDVTARKTKAKADQSAEAKAAAELVRLAKEQGLSLTGPDGLLRQLTKTVLETALKEEMTEHLGYEKHQVQQTLIPGPRGWPRGSQRQVDQARGSGMEEVACAQWPATAPNRAELHSTAPAPTCDLHYASASKIRSMATAPLRSTGRSWCR